MPLFFEQNLQNKKIGIIIFMDLYIKKYAHKGHPCTQKARTHIQALALSYTIFMTQTICALENNYLYQNTESFNFSEVSSIKQFAKGLKGPELDDGELAITTSHIELGHKFHINKKIGGISYAIFARFDYFLEFSNDTAIIAYADKNKLPIPEERTYKIDLAAQHLRAHGLKLGYHNSYFKNIDAQFYVSFLEANNMIDGRIYGQLSDLSDSPSGELILDYQYSEDQFFDRERSELTAKGYTVDIDIQWRPSPTYHINIKSKDLFSNIMWKNQDRTVGSATTNRIDFDDEGQLNVRPALSWRESQRDLNQRLPIQLTLQGNYNVTSRDTLQLETFRYDTHYFSHAAYHHRFGKKIYVGLSYNIDLKATGFELNTPYFKLNISADDYDYEQAKALEFTLGFYVLL